MLPKDLMAIVATVAALIAFVGAVFGKDKYRTFNILVAIYFKLWAIFVLLKF